MAGNKKKKGKKKVEENKDNGLSAKDLLLKQEWEDTRRRLKESPNAFDPIRGYYHAWKAKFKKMKEPELKQILADILSFMAFYFPEEGESLRFKLQGTVRDIDYYDLDYVRNLAKEIGNEFQQSQAAEISVDDLMDLVKAIVTFAVPFEISVAVDLLLKVDKLEMLMEHVDKHFYKLTCSGLIRSLSEVSKPYDVLNIAYQLYLKFNDFPGALRVALKLENAQYVNSTFSACKDQSKKQQLRLMLCRQGTSIELDEEMIDNGMQWKLLKESISNSKSSEDILTLARDLDVMKPKTPDDLYKAHLVDGRASAGASVDSAPQNLAAIFFNGFVNAGFGVDKLMTAATTETSGEGSSGGWPCKYKEHEKASAAASLGLNMLWDVDGGVPLVDEYLRSNDNYVVAGALLAMGIINCGVRRQPDSAYAVLHDNVSMDDLTIRIAAIMGLGLAYAGSQKKEVLGLLTPIVQDSKVGIELAGFAAVALGLIYVGSCNEFVKQSIVLALRDRSEAELGEPLARFLCLGLSLLYLGKQDAADATMEIAKSLNEKISKYCLVTLESCAYAGTVNPNKVKALVKSMSRARLEKGDNHQAPAVLGIALIAMAEEKTSRTVHSLVGLLQNGEQSIRRTVPLAFGILFISNPKIDIMDILYRCAHDSDSEVAMSATVSLGLIGAGTNNVPIADKLRQLSSYYKDPSLLFCVRIAQGLVHMGKGLLTLNPFHSDRFLLSNVALAGLITFLHTSFDMKTFILGKFHYVLYFLVLAMQPRMLITLDENLKPLPVPVSITRAEDELGWSFDDYSQILPSTSHTTPVILGTGDRARLHPYNYIPLSPVLEGFVILKESFFYTLCKRMS